MARRHLAILVGFVVTAAACGTDPIATPSEPPPVAPPEPPPPPSLQAVDLSIEVAKATAYPNEPIGVIVRALRSSGATATDFAGSVTIALDSAGAGTTRLLGTTTVQAVAGIATFSDLNVSDDGTFRLRATSSGLRPAAASVIVLLRLTRIAFATCEQWGGPLDDEYCTRSGIVVREPDGSERVIAQSAEFVPEVPAWSPDGRRIAYTGYHHCKAGDWAGCRMEIYLINADGSGLTRLTKLESAGNSYSPTWSPDGTRIAFSNMSDNGTGSRLYTVSATAIDPVPVVWGTGMGPAWSPDGQRLAFAADDNGRWAIYVANTDGSARVKLTDPGVYTGDTADDYQPSWSPDGTRLAFTRAFHRPNGSGYCQVYLVSIDGASSANPLTTDAFCAHAASWSPDGTRIAYNGQESPGQYGVMLMRADGSRAALVRHTLGWPSRVSWSPK